MGLIHRGMKYDRNHKDGDKCPDLKSIYKVELTGLGDSWVVRCKDLKETSKMTLMVLVWQNKSFEK